MVVVTMCVYVYVQLDAYDLLSKEPPTATMADNQSRELLGT